MPRKPANNKWTETVASLRLEYIQAAAWYWFRAEDREETMESMLNRMKAQNLHQRFANLNIPLPSPDEIYAYAADKWPAHKLHRSMK